MTTYVMRNGELVEKSQAEALFQAEQATHIISDNMGMVKHHGTGLWSDSKSNFRKMTKASGCVEIGNEIPQSRARQPIKMDKRERREAIGKAIYQLKNG